MRELDEAKKFLQRQELTKPFVSLWIYWLFWPFGRWPYSGAFW